MASDDLAALSAFRDAYKKGTDVVQVRRRLRALQPPQRLSAARPAIMVTSALAVLVLGAAVAWLETRPSTENQQVSTAATAPPAASIAAPAASGQEAKTTPPQPKVDVASASPAAVPSNPPAASSARIAPPTPSPDEVAWLLLKDTADEVALKHFITQFPDSRRRKDAEARIAALATVAPSPPADQAAWNLVKDSKDPDDLRRFIQEFPNSAERANAEQRIASLSVTAPHPAIATPSDPHELTRSLQSELQRVGCFKGAENGEFDDATKAAWHRFLKLTSLNLPDDVSSDAINAVRGINKRICPLACPHGEHAEGEACVANNPPPLKHTAARVAPAREPTPQISAPAAAPIYGRAPPAAAGCETAGRSGLMHALPGGGCGY